MLIDKSQTIYQLFSAGVQGAIKHSVKQLKEPIDATKYFDQNR